MFFLSKVKYEKILENGMQKRVTENFLVDAMSCTEAEARTIEGLKPYVTGDFFITDTKQANYYDVCLGSGDRYFDAKVRFITLDEKSGTEKKTNAKILIQADNVREANDKLDQLMSGTLADWECYAVNENSIIDVFLYEEDTEEKVHVSEVLIEKAKTFVLQKKCVAPSFIKSCLKVSTKQAITLHKVLLERKYVEVNEWIEDFVDESTGNIIPIERKEYTFNN